MNALGGPDDLERARLALLRRVAPGRDPVAAEDRADRVGVVAPDLGHVEAELEARAGARSTQATRSPKQLRVSASPSAAVASAIPESGWRWSTWAGVDEAVHRRVDRRRGAAPAVQAVVERGDHLVLALDAGVDVDERAQAVEPQDGEPGLGQRAEVAAGALDPQQLDRRAGHRVDAGALGRGVAAGVVRVPRVRAEPVGALEELADGRARLGRRRPRRSCAPARLPGRRRARPRSARRSRIGRRRAIGSGSRPRPVADLGEERPDVRVVGVHQDGVGAQDVAARAAPRRAPRHRRGAPWPSPPGRS